MDGRHYHGSERRFNKLASLPANPKLFSEQGLSSRSPKTYNHVGLNRGDLGFEPRPASFDLR